MPRLAAAAEGAMGGKPFRWVARLAVASALLALTANCGGGDGGGGLDGDYTPPELELTVVTRAVTVALPAGRQAATEGWTVGNSIATAPLDAAGNAQLDAWDGGPQLTVAKTPGDQIALMGWVDADHRILDARSTAEVLAYFELALFANEPSVQLAAIERFRDEPLLEPLRASVEAALAADPGDLSDGHEAVSSELDKLIDAFAANAAGRGMLIQPSTAQSGI